MFGLYNPLNKTSVWSYDEWKTNEARTRERALPAASEAEVWKIINAEARRVLRTYSTSFFIVTRFLPPSKREQVEIIYAAVRFPDEVVDTFPLSPDERSRVLDEWSELYRMGLACASMWEALSLDVPWILAGFTKVVREARIPEEHYRAFLEAMSCDIAPRPFQTLEDLIENYIYGSAIVVGYFLTYCYGSRGPEQFERALLSAKHLGIALQLTNFLRDVGEDWRRGRVYLPLDFLRDEGIEELDFDNAGQHQALARVLGRMSEMAEQFYALAERDVEAFATDSQMAIRACINVYRRLNERIRRSRNVISHRASVPMREKFEALPPSKYWRLPLAYLRR